MAKAKRKRSKKPVGRPAFPDGLARRDRITVRLNSPEFKLAAQASSLSGFDKPFLLRLLLYVYVQEESVRSLASHYVSEFSSFSRGDSDV